LQLLGDFSLRILCHTGSVCVCMSSTSRYFKFHPRPLTKYWWDKIWDVASY